VTDFRSAKCNYYNFEILLTGKEKKSSKVGSDPEFAKPPIPARFVQCFVCFIP
jgi:hypothetical protein